MNWLKDNWPLALAWVALMFGLFVALQSEASACVTEHRRTAHWQDYNGKMGWFSVDLDFYNNCDVDVYVSACVEKHGGRWHQRGTRIRRGGQANISWHNELTGAYSYNFSANGWPGCGR